VHAPDAFGAGDAYVRREIIQMKKTVIVFIIILPLLAAANVAGWFMAIEPRGEHITPRAVSLLHHEIKKEGVEITNEMQSLSGNIIDNDAGSQDTIFNMLIYQIISVAVLCILWIHLIISYLIEVRKEKLT